MMNVYSDSIIALNHTNAEIPKDHSDVIDRECHQQPPLQRRLPQQQPQQQNVHKQCTPHRLFIRNHIGILHGQQPCRIASTLNMINDMDRAKRDSIGMVKEPVPISMSAL